MAETDNLDSNLEESEDVQQQQFADTSNSFFEKNKKNIIILSGILVIIVVITVSYRILYPPQSNNKNLLPTMKTEESSIININSSNTNAEIKNREKKKKRKKIKYEKLYTLDSGQVSELVKELSFANILFKMEQNGSKYSVYVDEVEIEKARNLLAVKGLPSGTAKGYALLDNTQTLGVTEFDKRIRFLRALSGELEQAITQFEMIENAKVQIVLPEHRLFSVSQPPVTSSILIRKSEGSIITDDVVFSIIQLVSNAVENLKSENVSIIDTSGFVLSEGIFERMKARKEGDKVKYPKRVNLNEEALEDKIITREKAVGKPLIPNYKSISEWFDVKWTFEKVLSEKATKQLKGVLPLGSYKIAVSSDIGPIENGEIVDVRRLTVSIVVDQNNDEVYLDKQVKQEVYNTIASAIGYVKGRDKIILSVADFTLLSNQEKREIQKIVGNTNKWNEKNGFFIALVALIILIGMILGFRIYQKNKRLIKTDKILTSKQIEEKDDFLDIKDEIKFEKSINELQSFSQNNPKKVADLLTFFFTKGQVDVDAQPTIEEISENNESLIKRDENSDVLFDDDTLFEEDIFSESPELQEDTV